MKHFEDYESVKDLLSPKDIEMHEAGIPTTFEMDELITREDILKRHRIVMQCMDCNKWTEMNKPEPMKVEIVPCVNCGSKAYDTTSSKSWRSYDPLKDNKRRIKVAIRRAHTK